MNSSLLMCDGVEIPICIMSLVGSSWHDGALARNVSYSQNFNPQSFIKIKKNNRLSWDTTRCLQNMHVACWIIPFTISLSSLFCQCLKLLNCRIILKILSNRKKSFLAPKLLKILILHVIINSSYKNLALITIWLETYK